MYTCAVRPEIAALSAYVPGMSIAEIQEKYGLAKVVKNASMPVLTVRPTN